MNHTPGEQKNQIVLANDFSIIKTEPFRAYTELFVQRIPSYAIKIKSGSDWVIKKKPMSDLPVSAHLMGKYSVGTFSKWYPEFCILDIDSRPRETVDEVRGELGLDENNSMLFNSESADSYHVLVKPKYREKPPTARLLNNSFRGFCDSHKIEIYPKTTRAIRLPFGPKQNALDFEYVGLTTWEDKLFWFQKLDDFDLTTVKGQQLNLDLSTFQRPSFPSIMQEAAFLFQNGLQCPSSRHKGQFKVLYSLWRQNLTQEAAIQITFGWILKHHNGFSKDILRYPRHVKAEIERQAARIWEHYELSRVYPDSTHNLFNGFISKPDVERIIQVGQGSLPRMRFLFHLVKFVYPRRFRPFVNVSTKNMIEWGHQRTYMKYLNELEEKGILKRGKAYFHPTKDNPGKAFAKSIKLNWPFKTSSEPVLFDGRSIETLEGTLKTVFEPRDLRELVESTGTSRQLAYELIKRIYVK